MYINVYKYAYIYIFIYNQFGHGPWGLLRLRLHHYCHIYKYICTYVYICIHVCIYIYLYTTNLAMVREVCCCYASAITVRHTCEYGQVVYIYVYVYINIHAYVHVYIYACKDANLWLSTTIIDVCVYICIYMYRCKLIISKTASTPTCHIFACMYRYICTQHLNRRLLVLNLNIFVSTTTSTSTCQKMCLNMFTCIYTYVCTCTTYKILSDDMMLLILRLCVNVYTYNINA